MNQEIIEKLESMNACPEAVLWAEKQKNPLSAWNNCNRGDWMLWVIGKTIKTDQDHKKLVLAACKCARLSLIYVPKGETRPLTAIETAEAWAKNKKGVSLDDVRNAAYTAAYAAAYTAASAAAYTAAYTAAYAAAYAAASATAYTAASEAAYAARTKTLKQASNIVREFYPKPREL